MKFQLGTRKELIRRLRSGGVMVFDVCGPKMNLAFGICPDP
jgi:hypothetical protein